MSVASTAASRADPAASAPSRTRLLSLDVLRGVAIVLVMGRHAPLHPLKSGHWLPLSGLWARFGWTGVDLFFVLSGFLVGGLLFKELRARGKIDVGRFLIRRGLKIWPPYFGYLAFVAGVLLWETHGQAGEVGRRLLPNVLQVQNYFGTPRLHTWSLAVEEHFYLLLPLVLLLSLRVRAGRVDVPSMPLIALLLLACCTTWRCYLAYHKRPFLGEDLLTPTHLRIDSLFWGVLLAYLYHFRAEALHDFVVRRRKVLFFVGLTLVCPMMVLRVKDVPFVPGIGAAMLTVGYGCILSSMLYVPVGKGICGRIVFSPAGRFLAFIGTYSYSIYLWHYEVSGYMVTLVQQGLLAQMPPEGRWFCLMTVYLSLSLTLGLIMAWLVEKPTLVLRNRFFPARANTLPGSAHGAEPGT